MFEHFGAKLKSIRAVLDFISRKWEISWDDRQQVVEIKIPKFKQLLDGEAVKKASEKRQPGDNQETTRRQPGDNQETTRRQPKDIRETALELEPDLERSLLHKTSFKTRVEKRKRLPLKGVWRRGRGVKFGSAYRLPTVMKQHPAMNLVMEVLEKTVTRDSKGGTGGIKASI